MPQPPADRRVLDGIYRAWPGDAHHSGRSWALAEAGCSFADVVRVRYLLPDRADFEPCWPTLRSCFGDIRPAATMLVCGLADPRMKLEIEVYARRPAEPGPVPAAD